VRVRQSPKPKLKRGQEGGRYAMDKKVFNKVYAKYFKKDYFTEKYSIRLRCKYLSENGYNISLTEIKNYLKTQKEKCFNMMIERIADYKAGKFYPQSEKFTWSIIKELGL